MTVPFSALIILSLFSDSVLTSAPHFFKSANLEVSVALPLNAMFEVPL